MSSSLSVEGATLYTDQAVNTTFSKRKKTLTARCVGLFLASIRRQRVSRTCFAVPFTQIHTPPPLFPFSFRGRGIRIDVFALTFRSFPNPPSSPLFVSLFFVAAATPLLPPDLIPRGRGIGAPPSRRPSNPTRSKEAGGKGEGRRGGLRGASLLLSERCSDYPPRQRQRKERKSREKEAPLLLLPSLRV